jgi:predicted CXXCH cytochrome family protein
MRKFAVALMVVFFAASAATAADTVVLKAKNGDVTFDHKKHSSSGDCKSCHGEATPGKIALGKDAAHKLCKGCHESKKAGPTKCGDCHKK